MVADQMDLAANNKFLLGITLLLSLMLHAWALSYVPVERYKQPQPQETPSLRIKLTKLINETQKQELQTLTADAPQTKIETHRSVKSNQPRISKHSARKLAKTAPKTEATPVVDTSPTTRAMVEPNISTKATIATKTTETPPADTPAALASRQTPIESATSISLLYTTAPKIPAYVNNPKPLYPLAAKRRGMQGSVLLEVTVSATGTAAQINIKVSSGFRLLDRAAREAVAAWTFIPATKNGENIEATVEIPVRFELTKG
jgi:protein TonB